MRWGGVLLAAFFATVLSLYLNPYSFGTGDHHHYLAFLNKIENPSLYPGDLLFESMAAHHSYFLNGVALLSSEKTRPYWFFALHFLVSLATAVCLYRIGLRVAKNRLTALVFLTFCIGPGFGLSVSHQMFKPHSFALPFLLAALELFLARRFAWAFFLAGLMLHIQGQYACYFLFAFALALIPELGRLRIKGLAKIVLALMVAAAPLALSREPAIASHLTPEQLRQYFQVARARVEGSVAILNAPYEDWQPLILSLAAASFCWLNKDCRRTVEPRIIWFLPPVAIMIIAGMVFGELFPVHPIFLQFMFFRSKMIAVLVLLLFASAWVARLLTSNSLPQNIFGASWLIVPKLFDGELKSLVMLVAVAVFLILARIRTLAQGHSPIKPAIVAAIFIGVILSPKRPPFRVSDDFPFIIPRKQIAPEWMEVQLWARNHTPENALFLTPPSREGFRVHSMRSTVVEWKDGAPLTFAPLALLEWWQRMQKLGYQVDLNEEILIKPESIPPAKLLEAARQYHASFVVVPNPGRLELPLKFQNSHYAIYALP